MVVGLDDNFGMVVISYFDPKDKSKGNPVQRVADRILLAANTLSSGDVLQLEAKFEGKIGKCLAIRANAPWFRNTDG
jgi:hypothetical protein